MALRNLRDCQLVTLKPGQYWRARLNNPYVPADLKLKEPTSALLIEFQGLRRDGHEDDECWHALVGGQVVLVWESSFDKTEKA